MLTEPGTGTRHGQLPSPSRPEPARRAGVARPASALALCPSLLAVSAASLAAALVFSWVLLARHANFFSNAYDLGFFDQIIWNTSQGRWFETSFVEYNFLGQHVEPILLVYAALYRIWPSPELLLVTQAFAAAAAAVPLYLLARRWLVSPTAAVFVAAAFLLSASLHQAVLFDFHPEVLGLPVVFSAVALLAAGRPSAATAVFCLLFLLKEEAALAGLGLGWFLWWRGFRSHGLGLAAGSLLYLVLVAGFVMGAFRGGEPGDLQRRYGYLGTDVPGVVLGALGDPAAVVAHLSAPATRDGLVGMVARLGFLPLASPLALGALPVTALHALSLHPEQRALQLQYGTLPFALLFVAAIDALRLLQRILRRRTGVTLPDGPPSENTGHTHPLTTPAPHPEHDNHFAGIPRVPVLPALLPALLLTAAVAAFFIASPLGLRFNPGRFAPTPHVEAAGRILALVPPDIPVSAQAGFVPHLSQRTEIYEFPRLSGARAVLIDRHEWKSTYSQTAGYDRVLAALPSMGYQLVASGDGVELYCWQGRCE